MTCMSGKTVCITGATSGIGEACAKLFAGEGAKLILLARRGNLLEKLKKECGDKDILTGVVDVSKRKEVEAFFAGLPDNWKDIDLLVNNAGLGLGLDKLHEADPDDWDRMIDTNVKGLLYVSRAVLPGMVKRDSGHVINIGSIAGRELYPGGNVYCASKFAVRALTKALKIDLLGTKVRVTTIDPGMVETGFSEVRFKGDIERAKKVYEGMTPLTGGDIADAVHWVATRPPRVDILEMVVVPTDQSGATFVHRRTKY
ncbi:MAG TPA: SDR family oxidoreductase [Acidobacteriota bacterium]|nr:SDR family oxidoreductase [Acidobacteriota bacterium]HNT16323.1 SDR family oxidoreductase [Acidobacteriota bacterium]